MGGRLRVTVAPFESSMIAISLPVREHEPETGSNDISSLTSQCPAGDAAADLDSHEFGADGLTIPSPEEQSLRGHGSFGERAARLRLARQVSYGVSTLNSVDGDANVAEYDVFRSTSLQLVVSGWCSLTGNEIAIIELSNGATVTLNRPFTFGVVALKPGATFKVLAPVTITGNFAAEGTID